MHGIEQKGMTFDHDFCYFILLSLHSFLGGKRKGEWITKVLVKSYAFLLDHAWSWFVNILSKIEILFFNFFTNLLYGRSLFSSIQGRVHGGGTPPPFKFRGGYYPPRTLPPPYPPRHSQLILLQSKRHCSLILSKNNFNFF